VRFPRFLSSLFLFTLVLASACNRGSHPAQAGKPAPDFTVNDGSTAVRLANYRGKVVLLNFWATWCQPCVAELPSLIQLHHDMPNLVVLGISIDEDPDAYSRFLTRHHIDFTTVRDPAQSSPKLFHTDMWPETYVIDRNGYIRSKYIGAQDWSDPEIRTFLRSL
jgi:cytochrome c biogenesis protein CcmG, thiol:disulfide interchange protein DsbE